MVKRTKGKKRPALRLENRRLKDAGHSQEDRSDQLSRGLRTIQDWDSEDREFLEAEEVERDERRRADAEALSEMQRVARSLEIAKAELDAERQRPSAKDQLTPLQREVYDRCQLRSVDFPEGDHGWMSSGNEVMRYQDHAFSEEIVAELTDQEGIVTLRHIKTCSICWKYTTEWSVTGPEIGFSIVGELPYLLSDSSLNTKEPKV